MNMFKHYDGTWDWNVISIFSVGLFCSCLLVWFIVSAVDAEQKKMSERHAYKIKCIDAGGAPVAPFDYVKGHGEGYLCINPSAIIEVN